MAVCPASDRRLAAAAHRATLHGLTGLFDVNTLPTACNGVLNGIAWDAQHKRLFVTGKHWPKLFEIKLVRRGL